MSDYDVHGHGYAQHRRSDPRIAAPVHRALGDARTVLNVGAGTGSYEPEDRYVLAVEPSATMRAQRDAHRAPAISALEGVVAGLSRDLEQGAWDERHGALRTQRTYESPLRLVVSPRG